MSVSTGPGGSSFFSIPARPPAIIPAYWRYGAPGGPRTNRGAVPVRRADGAGALVAGPEPLVRVDPGGEEGACLPRVDQGAREVVHHELGELVLRGGVEERVLPVRGEEALMHVHPPPIHAEERFRHEGRVGAGLEGHGPDCGL